MMVAHPDKLFAIALGIVLIMWFVNAIRNGQQYVQRFIDEDLCSPNRPSPDD